MASAVQRPRSGPSTAASGEQWEGDVHGVVERHAEGFPEVVFNACAGSGGWEVDRPQVDGPEHVEARAQAPSEVAAAARVVKELGQGVGRDPGFFGQHAGRADDTGEPFTGIADPDQGRRLIGTEAMGAGRLLDGLGRNTGDAVAAASDPSS